MDPSNGRILIVDDHARNVAILKKILGPGRRLATASSGEEAIEIARSFLPDLALLDIMMPGIDGYETCRRLRQMKETAHTKIIMVSAKAMVSERLAGYEAGADDYVVKPFDDDELVAKVRIYLKLKSAEEVDRLKTDILMLINHETRTPLTTILSPLSIVLDDPTLTPATRELIEMAGRGARRLNDFIERMTGLSQLLSGMVEFHMQRERLDAVVSGAIALMRPIAEAAQVTFVEKLGSGIEADVDSGQVREALRGFLDNAIRLGPAGGSIEVALEAREGSAFITVTDQGPGVPPEFLPHVFDGMQVPDIRQHQRGHGLSLVASRAIARHHGGGVSARNLESGGAEFTLQLPLPVVARPSSLMSVSKLIRLRDAA